MINLKTSSSVAFIIVISHLTGLEGLSPLTPLSIASLLQHALSQVLLPQVEAKVAVTGKIASGVPLETSLQGI